MTGDVLDRLAAAGVVPVVEIDDAESAVPLARALVEGGLPAVEVTFRTAAAPAAIERIAAEVPEIVPGAGTLLTPAHVRQAIDAGAAFGVSPGSSPELFDAVAGWPFVPGAVTPVEIMACLAAGHDVVKFFPAGTYGGLAAVRALAGPFGTSGVRFLPTGGITAQSAPEYLAHPAVFAVGGTWVAPRADVAAGNWAAITERARAAAGLRASEAGAGAPAAEPRAATTRQED
ncbi:bifunctional 4-hydroxy-2-oxoglutarate aldolase/2-dehydro-3-deoxy-phosphogluconate aldolase [Pseudonocardia nematodicida]|uniref:2-dehydro-3-deoxy-phosphogluconate aldolase n=1 Tax=Pseudonocardia nematodicida TaxID=1206997 RepID=A0ABV1KHC5_9PSEU